MSCPNQTTLHYIVFIVWQIFELWLGKTDKVRSGSTLELAFSTIELIMCKVKEKFSKEK